jgi:outer membrane lipoprotein carrier protein
MRRLLIGSGIVIVVLLIALAVRGQTRRTPPADAAPAQHTDTSGPSASAPPAIDEPAGAGRPAPAPTATNQPQPPANSGERPYIEHPDPRPDAPSVQEGAAVLKRAAAAYGRITSMRASFVQRRENPLLGSNITSRGTLYQRDPDRFALKFTEPAGDLIVGDGRYFWLYYPSVDRKQVLRAPARQGAGAVDLQSQFIGDPLTRFTHVYHGTEKQNGRTVHVLTLTPRQDAGYQTLKVWVDGGDYLVRRFQITEPTGVVVEFQLSNVTVNPTLGDAIFRFSPPAGASIIER